MPINEDEDPLVVYIHGLSNQPSFEGGRMLMDVGAQEETAEIGQRAVLLSVTGVGTDGKQVDIEIAVPQSKVIVLIHRLQNRSKTGD